MSLTDYIRLRTYRDQPVIEPVMGAVARRRFDDLASFARHADQAISMAAQRVSDLNQEVRDRLALVMLGANQKNPTEVLVRGVNLEFDASVNVTPGRPRHFISLSVELIHSPENARLRFRDIHINQVREIL